MKNSIFFIVILLAISACSSRRSPVIDLSDDDVSLDSVLNVVTLEKYSSFYVQKKDSLGFEYEVLKRFVKANPYRINLIVVNSLDELHSVLERGEADVSAFPITITHSLDGRLNFVGNERITRQVLVQRKERGKKPMRDVSELVGKKITVAEGSKYLSRLRNLSEELGGEIEFDIVSAENNDELLIKKVVGKGIDLTVADEDIADYYSRKYSNLDCDLDISLEQRSAWAVRLGADSLSAMLDTWLRDFEKSSEYQYLRKKYFERGIRKSGAQPEYINSTTISEYDALFKKYSPILGWNWKLVASIAYQETKFDNSVESYRGARGIMQLMPNTAYAYGADSTSIAEAETNIRVAVEYLKSVERIFSNVNDEDRYKFVLASYNAGVGHVKDAMALAEKYGKDACKWEGNVADYLVLKSNELYYTDPVVKHGSLRGAEVCKFVNDILVRYQQYCDVIH